ncbi:MAG: YicC/YloC family endoribonuclease [Thermovenabulum sp.]|uniref:YicC/YloC family endoribonuclease n=1 Tax=Thermovenabulum sp. TaxID=3100335 RepID=UPI003C7EB9B5
MAKSMTGYGRGKSSQEFGWEVEIKTVNHRFLDIYIRLPKPWLFLEEKIRSFIKERISRGRVDVYINYCPENFVGEIKTDDKTIEAFYCKLLEIKEKVGFEGPITLQLLSLLPDIFKVEKNVNDEELWVSLKPALNEAVMNLDKMREEEGKVLIADIEKRLDKITQKLDVIKSRREISLLEYKNRLEKRISELVDKNILDKERLEMEVAYFAERSDINEEIVRMESHIIQFKSLFGLNEPIGKKMDFIAQELFREVNTIASKSADYEISKQVIDIKSELEKIREQVQNLE